MVKAPDGYEIFAVGYTSVTTKEELEDIVQIETEKGYQVRQIQEGSEINFYRRKFVIPTCLGTGCGGLKYYKYWTPGLNTYIGKWEVIEGLKQGLDILRLDKIMDEVEKFNYDLNKFETTELPKPIAFSKLPKKDKKHLRENKISTKQQLFDQIKFLKEEKAKRGSMRFPCWECWQIGKKLGLVV